jgi:hypothetical protein
MKAPEEEPEQDDIVNPDQFQVGRAPENEKDTQTEGVEYTDDEIEFADGAGTQLDDELDAPDREDLETELDDDDDAIELDESEEE